MSFKKRGLAKIRKRKLHFSFHLVDILPKLPSRELRILVEYQLNWMKIVFSFNKSISLIHSYFLMLILKIFSSKSVQWLYGRFYYLVRDFLRDLNPQVPHDSLQLKSINLGLVSQNPFKVHSWQLSKLSTQPWKTKSN